MTTTEPSTATMAAITQHGYGGIEVLSVDRMPVPSPAPNQVLVRVLAGSPDSGTVHLMTGDPLAVRPVIGLRTPRQPIIGLAKEREEVYVPDQAEPIVMPHSMGALKLLQRIRDEAHRWANGYHQILMKRRIGESILDDCPGISPAKKKALLAEFGSVARLRRLTPETIARLPGVSLKLATELRAWLDTH